MKGVGDGDGDEDGDVDKDDTRSEFVCVFACYANQAYGAFLRDWHAIFGVHTSDGMRVGLECRLQAYG